MCVRVFSEIVTWSQFVQFLKDLFQNQVKMLVFLTTLICLTQYIHRCTGVSKPHGIYLLPKCLLKK